MKWEKDHQFANIDDLVDTYEETVIESQSMTIGELRIKSNELDDLIQSAVNKREIVEYYLYRLRDIPRMEKEISQLWCEFG